MRQVIGLAGLVVCSLFIASCDRPKEAQQGTNQSGVSDESRTLVKGAMIDTPLAKHLAEKGLSYGPSNEVPYAVNVIRLKENNNEKNEKLVLQFAAESVRHDPVKGRLLSDSSKVVLNIDIEPLGFDDFRPLPYFAQGQPKNEPIRFANALLKMNDVYIGQLFFDERSHSVIVADLCTIFSDFNRSCTIKNLNNGTFVKDFVEIKDDIRKMPEVKRTDSAKAHKELLNAARQAYVGLTQLEKEYLNKVPTAKQRKEIGERWKKAEAEGELVGVGKPISSEDFEKAQEVLTEFTDELRKSVECVWDFASWDAPGRTDVNNRISLLPMLDQETDDAITHPPPASHLRTEPEFPRYPPAETPARPPAIQPMAPTGNDAVRKVRSIPMLRARLSVFLNVLSKLPAPSSDSR